MGATISGIKKSLRSFTGVPFRQEIIVQKKGVVFINDTTATTPEASLVAVQRFFKKNKKLWWICGGTDKGLNFNSWLKIKPNKNLQALLLSGSANDKIKQVFQKNKIIFHEFSSLTSIFNFLKNNLHSGDIVLFSPGATSFGLFKK